MINTMKHKRKNYKKTTPPAKHLHDEFIAIDENGVLRASFDKEEELMNFLSDKKDLLAYKLSTFSYNGNKLNIKTRKD